MLFRGKSGKLYEINKSDYLTEKEYNRAIMAIKFQVVNNLDKPDILFNPAYSSFKKNTLMSCGLCVILLLTVIYSTYSLLF